MLGGRNIGIVYEILIRPELAVTVEMQDISASCGNGIISAVMRFVALIVDHIVPMPACDVAGDIFIVFKIEQQKRLEGTQSQLIAAAGFIKYVNLGVFIVQPLFLPAFSIPDAVHAAVAQQVKTELLLVVRNAKMGNGGINSKGKSVKNVPRLNLVDFL